MKFFFCYLLIFPSLLVPFSSNCQNVYQDMRSFTVSIGYVITPPNSSSKFIQIGSGIMTYVMADTVPIVVAVTAKHVIKFFEDNHIAKFYVRPSWADTIKTSTYPGIPCYLKDNDNNKLYYTSVDPLIDLGCIIIDFGSDTTALEYYSTHRAKTFPLNRISDPQEGQEVVIYGYPDHIENVFTQFDYIICTFKEGMVTWNRKLELNSELNNFFLVESNSTYGNSGGPVFSIKNKFGQSGDVELAGIIHGGFNDTQTVKAGQKTIIDSLTNTPYTINSRAGVTTVIKASFVREMLRKYSDILTAMMSKRIK